MHNLRVNEIDLMRFVAALSVVLFHYAFRGYAADNMSVMPYPLMSGIAQYGYLGVDLFFMISGFVILMSAYDAKLRDFVVSRVIRLYPAFWISCTTTFIFALVFGDWRFPVSITQYLANLTMLGEFIGVPPIDGVYWSLFIEIRFYFLVSLVLAFRQMQRVEMLLLGWLGVTVLAFVIDMPKLSKFFIADWSAYFIAGATSYCIWKNGASIRRVATFVGALTVACYHALTRLSVFSEHYHVELNSYAVVLIICAFHGVFVLIAARKTAWVGRADWTMVGAMTYPLYLLHQNIGFMIINAAYPALNEHLVFAMTVSSMLLASYAVHRFFERPVASAMKPLLTRMLARLRPTSAVQGECR